VSPAQWLYQKKGCASDLIMTIKRPR